MPARKTLPLLWLAAYLLVNAACHLSAGTNADSRLAALLAMSRDGTFRIDAYREMTDDWSRTPDGHYYSNKAPGAMFMAVLPFWAWDCAFPTTWENKAGALKFLSYLLQLVPFLILVLALCRWWRLTPAAEVILLAAVLFGNSAALFMSTFYGHGLASVLFLAAIYFTLRRSYAWAGSGLGFCVLTDYSAALFVVPFLVWIFSRDRRAVFAFIAGALPAAALWCWYHAAAFGSPFAIANQFQNPVYQDVVGEAGNVWGVLRPFPRFGVLAELLFGTSRGILWTQPWVLFCMAFPLFAKLEEDTRAVYLLLFTCTLLLLGMNASFGGWHGGLPPGPRYLSAVFPAWGVWLGWNFDRLGGGAKATAVLLVGFSVAFSALVYATELSAGVTPLWPLYLKRATDLTPSVLARLALLIPLLGSLIFFSYRLARTRVVSTT